VGLLFIEQNNSFQGERVSEKRDRIRLPFSKKNGYPKRELLTSTVNWLGLTPLQHGGRDCGKL